MSTANFATEKPRESAAESQSHREPSVTQNHRGAKSKQPQSHRVMEKFDLCDSVALWPITRCDSVFQWLNPLGHSASRRP